MTDFVRLKLFCRPQQLAAPRFIHKIQWVATPLLLSLLSHTHNHCRPAEILIQGWATFLVGGPYVGRRSPSRAGLLDGSSSICSTTIYYCQGRSDCTAKKKDLHTPHMSCFLPKISVKQWRSKKLQKGGHNFHIFFDVFFIQQNYFKAD